MVRCANCGVENPPGARFCDQCGAALAATPAATPANGGSACPKCGTSVLPGELFCDNCGEALQPGSTPAIPVAPAAPGAIAPVPPADTLAGWRLGIVANGIEIPLPARSECLIGRSDPASNHTPDVDLTPHNGLELGVGRRHAIIRIQRGAVTVEDLDSTNGTNVIDQRIAPRRPTAVQHGDGVVFGQLAVVLLGP
ncbi:MAG: zinc ribbon domain-containing protein [Chloroflexi bacterium]|nr:zinc ribbon domain-containing protein [Chloroflexota bacterium]